MIDPIATHLDEIAALCRRFGVRRIENMIGGPYFRQTVEATRQPVYDDRNAPAVA